MKVLKYIIGGLFLLVSVIINAANYNDIANEAAELYNKQEYVQAAEQYKSILQQGMESDKLYYNLGNCYFRQINYPAAILNYERALRLNPNNEDAKLNLAIANTRIVDKIEAIPTFFLVSWWNNFTSLLSVNDWAILSIVLFVLSCALFILYFISSNYSIRKQAFWSSMILVIFTVLSIACAIYQKHEMNKSEAIIFAPSVKIKSAPDFNSSDKFVLHEGTKVLILDHVNGYSKIKIGDGNVGWVDDEEIEKI